jgi:WD40 repeat protein
VAVAPDGKTLAYGSGDGVRLCEVETGKQVRELKVGDGGVLTMVFAADGKTLAVRGRNQRVRLWDVETGKDGQQLSNPEPRQGGGLVLFVSGFVAPETRSLALSPDGKRVAAAAGSTVRVWELASGKEVPLVDSHWRAPASIVVSPDGKTVVSWGYDRVVRRWEAATGKQLVAFPAPPRTPLAALSPDGETVAFANGDGTIRLHDTATGKERQQFKGPPGGTVALAFAPGGKVLAARAGGDNTVRLLDVSKGTEQLQIVITPPRPAGGGLVIVLGGGRAARGTGPGVAFSPDGRLVVTPMTAGGDPSNTLVFFDAGSGKELRKIESSQPIASYAFSPDGRTLAAENTDRTVTLWEVASGKERGRLGKAAGDRPQGGGGRMEVNVDGLAGIAGGGNEPGGAVGVTYSPDGRTLAVRGADRTVRVWDVAEGKEIGQLPGHAGRVETVAFAPGGKTIASGSADTTILLWDAVAATKGLAQPQSARLSAEELESIWGDLAGEDAAKALKGVRKLTAGSGQAAAFLGERVKPAATVDPDKINGWVGDLDSDQYAVRREAVANLVKVGEQAVPALRKVLEGTPTLETRKRAEDLVNRLTGGTLTSEQLRVVRAVESLELMATPEARRLLQKLSEGAPGTLTTREARAALDRLGR